MREKLKVSAPGRICLFGEHQDYLLLPVIPCAISVRIAIEGSPRNDLTVNIHLPNIGRHEQFELKHGITYIHERDYFRSTVNVLQRNGFSFSNGFDCTVQSTIPINSGTSSSSALVVAWVHFLARLSDQTVELSPGKTAEFAHKAEVLEFKEPGGMMDHFSTAIGEIIFLDFEPDILYEKMNAKVGSFVLGDSQEPKNTKFVLAHVKNKVIVISETLAKKIPGFSLRDTSVNELKKYSRYLTTKQTELLFGMVNNHQITKKAKALLLKSTIDNQEFGSLLNEHQNVLRDILRISTPKIDRMIDAALKAGAYGAKINGSGGGGCMFAYAPENPQQVLEAIEKEGGKGYIVHSDFGVYSDNMEI